MTDYDFLSLNDKEFEKLGNDVVQRREGKTVERYKPGRDGGADGRIYISEDKQIIIQSKHWRKSGVPALIRHLKKTELSKIKKLNPTRYILCTSLELSHNDKKKISNTINPYIKSFLDIIGSEDLNSLLDENPDIEENHYKL